jgi:hypothetical protein
LSLDQNYSIKWPTKTFILEIESNLKKYIWPEVPLPQEIVRVRDKIPDLAVVRLVALMIMGFRSVSSYGHLTNIFDNVAKKEVFRSNEIRSNSIHPLYWNLFAAINLAPSSRKIAFIQIPFQRWIGFSPCMCKEAKKSFLVRIFLFINFGNGQTISLKEKILLSTFC